MGRVNNLTLDSAGYITANSLPGESWTYDSTWHVPTSYTDADTHVTNWTVDSSTGHVIKMFDANTKETDYTYSATTGLLTKIVDPSTNETDYYYDSYLRLDHETSPLGTSYYTYDSHGNLASYEDPNTNITDYSFSVTGDFLSDTDPTGHSDTETYTSAGLPSTNTGRTGTVYVDNYDTSARGLVISSVAASGTTVAETDVNQYNADGELTGSRDGLGLWSSLGYVLTGAGEIDTSTDALGNVSKVAQNLDGETTDVRLPKNEVPAASSFRRFLCCLLILCQELETLATVPQLYCPIHTPCRQQTSDWVEGNSHYRVPVRLKLDELPSVSDVPKSNIFVSVR
jgi:YD repeat-containing protein